MLYGTHGIQRHAGICGYCSARLHVYTRHFYAEQGAFFLYGLRHLSYFFFNVKIRIGVSISYAVASAEVELLRLIAVLSLYMRYEPEHDHRCSFKNILREDLRADMAVKAPELYMLHPQCRGRKGLGLSRFYGDSEL